MFCTKYKFIEPITITVSTNQADLVMEVDTGASVSLMSEATYKQTCTGGPHLENAEYQAAYVWDKALKYSELYLNVDVGKDDQNERLPNA